jgi:hypothetical protein
LWVGWNEPLRLGVPKEVHIHANSWGFASLVFAGLLIDLLPVLVAPLIILGVSGVPGADIEATAPQALIYGWMLQCLYAVAPYFTARWLLQNEKARLGGNWLSLLAVNLGGVFVWASIFLLDGRPLVDR